MVEKAYRKKNGGMIIMNPDIISLIEIKRTPDNLFEVNWNGRIIRCTQYTQLGRLFKELNEERFDSFDIDV